MNRSRSLNGGIVRSDEVLIICDSSSGLIRNVVKYPDCCCQSPVKCVQLTHSISGTEGRRPRRTCGANECREIEDQLGSNLMHSIKKLDWLTYHHLIDTKVDLLPLCSVHFSLLAVQIQRLNSLTLCRRCPQV